jgi:hypothetical protein
MLAVASSGTAQEQRAGSPDAASAPHGTQQRVIRVGPAGEVPTIAEASRIARSGDTIEIEAGDYVGDVAVWAQMELTIRGVNGRPRLVAAGASAEGKGIWVVRGQRVSVENVAFLGARVQHRNGAGIRLERGSLTVRDCLFDNNENGILTANEPSIELVVENSEFARNGVGGGHTHTLYAGRIAKLVVAGSYFHEGGIGHLLKSRARESRVLYNRLTDEAGRASYELEFPDGGLAIVLGNLIEQGPRTENPAIVSFGAEGYRWPRNELHLGHNTIINDRPQGGVFVAATEGKGFVRAVNNLLVGKGSLEIKVRHGLSGNETAEWEEFALASRLDFRLKAASSLVGTSQPAVTAQGVALVPTHEYVHPVRTAPIPAGTPLSPGAFQSVAR